ncbi:peptide ABC transporter substrate-binding protein [Thermogemmatispora sp.]|uniref:peptide ABC transporter substrate-binding protein n=1 Tax=Thermogemmatispora sp. TaxID=1968838 RepID=UPI001D7AEA09|nr:peptide ABC transporter substrate-binding protein [Thermogemmatispora sp.]MBX5452095.1 peptide ABC transporter substrate-binding protein [Thermogemmatispora sp.]
MSALRKRTYPLGLALTLVCLLTLLLTACGGGTQTTSTQKAPASKQVFVYPEAGVTDIATFDPGLSTDLYSIQAIDMVFTGLVQLDNNLTVQPQLAASWQSSDDGLTWTFHLKPNLKFSDGTSLTSQDVAYSIDRALQPAEHSTTAPIYLALIKDSDLLQKGKIKTIINDSIQTPDPNTVVITIKKKAAYFLDALTYSCSYVVERKLIDKYGKSWTDHLDEGGGAGPFKVQSYQHGKQIVFVPNPNYYGPKPQLQKVIFPFYQKVETAYQAYRSGQVDEAGVPSPYIDQARKGKDFHLVPQLWINYYTMNYLVKPFDSINIRRAFALAINKNEIVHAVWKDTLIPTNHIVPQGMPGYNPNLKGPDGTTSTAGNPALANQYLEAGLKDEGLSNVSQLPTITLTYSTGSADSDREVAALVQQWQTVLHISVKAHAEDFNKLLEDIVAATNNPRGLQFWGIAWIADYPDPQDWLTLQFDAGVPNNNMNYGQNNSPDARQQQATQKLLEQADAMPNGPARYQAYNKAEQQLVNDVAWLPMEQVQAAYVVKTYVHGFFYNPQQLIPPDYWSQIYITQH